MKSQELRQLFLDFFRSKSHSIVSSAPMVIKNDPTLMFTNAGMNQFKDIFLGNQQPLNTRVANSQKCLRVSGKHNDLEEVGHDTYHHTMFEMLGNWSFGDYFKKEAIDWGWEFLVKKLGIPEDRIYATIFEGSPEEGVERDNESYNYWLNCFAEPEGKILEGSKKDNFWEMGETGPCGPCSEIHVDLRDDAERALVPGRDLVNMGHPHVIEIWNLVFIQYNRKADGSLELLPSRHVDTGMGFERLCMVIQGKKSNYDTDIFQSLISAISDITGKPYGVNEKWDVALRVIADHIRAVSFSIADGQVPSNNKAGYVIRRILRRAIRYGYNNLGTEEPFLYRLVPVLASVMGDHYPELVNSGEHIARVIFEEETAFLKTLGKGIKMIDRVITELSANKINILPGKTAFEMFDTYGFPVDLTQLILREHDMQLDVKGFEAEMARQKERSRADASVESADWIVVNDSSALTLFTGYDKTSDEVLILKYRTVKVKGKPVCQLVFNKTPFYAESGGQTGDTGYITDGTERVIISDTIKEHNLIIHISDKIPANPEASFIAEVNTEKRQMAANNHTATHLLHFALRTVLGNHVEQKGSLVSPERLRFDFSHFSKVTKEEIAAIETIVNRMIRENHAANVSSGIPMEQAIEKGAMALFGEKYGDTVRVVEFGPSIELCGGTHVDSTGTIGIFKIVSESAIAAGIRRIEAITAAAAESYISEKLEMIDEISSMLKSTSNVRDSIEKLLNENGMLRKSVEKHQRQNAVATLKTLEEQAEVINNIRFVSGIIDAGSQEILKNIAFQARNSSSDTIYLLGSYDGGKAGLMVLVSDNLVTDKNINAIAIIKEIAPAINGGGGGQPFMATAGGKNPAGIPVAISKAKSLFH